LGKPSAIKQTCSAEGAGLNELWNRYFLWMDFHIAFWYSKLAVDESISEALYEKVAYITDVYKFARKNAIAFLCLCNEFDHDRDMLFTHKDGCILLYRIGYI